MLKQVQLQLDTDDHYWDPALWTFRKKAGLDCQTPEGNDCGVFTVLWALQEALGINSKDQVKSARCNEYRAKMAYAWLKGLDGVSGRVCNLEAAGYVEE